MDAVILEKIAVRTVIGTMEDERIAPRELLVSLRLAVDLYAAGTSDSLADAVDYQELTEKVIELGRKSRFRLLEAFAEACARLCLEHRLVEAAAVTVEKPGILPAVKKIAVEITRYKNRKASL